MKRKLKRVLLVDDHEPDIVLHRMVFESLDCVEQIDVALDGAQAIEYLTTQVDGEYPRPNIICLDINMPVMNGWEFIEAYEKLPDDQTGGIVLMMISTTQNPDDAAAARGLSAVKRFTNKPLTGPVLLEVLQQHFPYLT